MAQPVRQVLRRERVIRPIRGRFLPQAASPARRRHGDQVSRSSVVGCILDVTNIVADGRRVVPCTRCRCTRRIVTLSAYDLVAVERAGNHRGFLAAFHDALPMVHVIAGRRLHRIGGGSANAERPCEGSQRGDVRFRICSPGRHGKIGIGRPLVTHGVLPRHTVLSRPTGQSRPDRPCIRRRRRAHRVVRPRGRPCHAAPAWTAHLPAAL